MGRAGGPDLLVGVDAGTTSFKAALCTPDGAVLAVARREYALNASGVRVEFPPERYWALFCAVVRDLFASSGLPPDGVAALAISSQGETFVCIGGNGEALGDAVVWLDNRSAAECAELRRLFTPRELYEHTGQYEVQPTWTATKLLWLKRHEPERFAATKKFLLLEDYLLYRLTGRFVCERTLPASTLLYDIPSGAWWGDMLRAVGVGEEKLPGILDSAAPVGPVTAEAAAQCGLTPRTLVAAGALDQIAMMVGAGNVRPGAITEVTGSCLVVETVLDRFAPWQPDCPLTCQPFCIPGGFLLMMFSNTAGMALKWFRDCMFPDGSMTYEALCGEAADVPPGAAGLMMLPHLAGAQFPRVNPDARGVFWGATLAHRRGHFVRAILESVACIGRSMLERIEASGYGCDRIFSVGGASSSAVWNRIKADVMFRPIETVGTPEPASVGAAALAGVACGLFRGVGEAADAMARPGGRTEPDEANRAAYDAHYRAFLALDAWPPPAMKPADEGADTACTGVNRRGDAPAEQA